MGIFKKHDEILSIDIKELESDPTNELALKEAVRYLDRLGKIDEAIVLCNKAINIAPNLVTPHVLLAYIYYEKNDSDNCLREAKMALKLDPNSSKTNCCYGVALYLNNEYQDAIQSLKKAIETEPDMILAHKCLRICYQRIGDGNSYHKENKTLARLYPTFENIVAVISSYFDKNRLIVAVFALSPILIIFNRNLKFLLLIYPPIVLLYIVNGFISLKNKQRQDSKSKFMVAAIGALILLSLLFILNN